MHEKTLPLLITGEVAETSRAVGESAAPLSSSEISITSPLMTNVGTVVELVPGGGRFSLSDQKAC